MASALFDQESNIQRIIVLSGMGGSGKTQIVSRFLRLYSERYLEQLHISNVAETL
jgi:hypothetical protein